MLEQSKEHQDRSGNVIKFYNNEFYTAIMDEDLGRIDDMSEKHGSNFLIKVRDTAPGEDFWKVNAIMQTFKKTNYLWDMEHVE